MSGDKTKVAIIGAGPSGSLAGAMLRRLGHDVVVLEKEQFPRFCIGESLLPQCMLMLQQAGLAEAVEQAGFQYKNGAAFRFGEQCCDFDFREKSSPGPGTTYQVERGKFDKLLADEAAAMGVDIRYCHSLDNLVLHEHGAVLDVFAHNEQRRYSLDAEFVLDASGYGRVLPRLLNLEQPSSLPGRTAIFTHIEDNIDDADYDRNKILISVHPTHRDIWFWLIPFANGRCSLGVVGLHEQMAEFAERPLLAQLQQWVEQEPGLSKLLANARYDTTVRQIKGYSANVSHLAGERYALLGNAAEFLDPVFSSGVTIACKSASLVVPCVDQLLRGNKVDWQAQYVAPLKVGIDTFRAYVEAWYDGCFQDVIFYPNPEPSVKTMISSILAGYAWDEKNPFVKHADRRLQTLVEVCRASLSA